MAGRTGGRSKLKRQEPEGKRSCRVWCHVPGTGSRTREPVVTIDWSLFTDRHGSAAQLSSHTLASRYPSLTAICIDANGFLSYESTQVSRGDGQNTSTKYIRFSRRTVTTPTPKSWCVLNNLLRYWTKKPWLFCLFPSRKFYDFFRTVSISYNLILLDRNRQLTLGKGWFLNLYWLLLSAIIQLSLDGPAYANTLLTIILRNSRTIVDSLLRRLKSLSQVRFNSFYIVFNVWQNDCRWLGFSSPENSRAILIMVCDIGTTSPCEL